ncbi:MAG: GntR family transcriptional regulator [Pseudomonadota bacterium]
MTIVIRTLSERVFAIVRDQIVAGTLPAGQAIRQDALAADLGISKIPLREALARLEQDGLLNSVTNRGYVVRGLSIADAEEICALRLCIEPEAVARAAGVASAKERDDAMRAYAALGQGGDDAAARSLDFRLALVRPGNRPLTAQLVERLAILAERYVVAYPPPPDRVAHNDDHRALIEAWMARDGAGVADVLRQQIGRALDDLRGQI